MVRRIRRFRCYLAVSFGVVVLSATALAQGPDGFQLLPELGGLNTTGPDANLQIAASLRMTAGSQVGLLEVTATMNKTWHVYSLTQPPGGPNKTVIKLAPSREYRLLGSFAPDRPPHKKFLDVFKIDGEEHSEQVTWSVPVEVAKTAASGKLAITGHVLGQVCADGGACIPLDPKQTRFTANVGNSLSAAETKSLAGQRVPGAHGSIRGWLSRSQVPPGEMVQLQISMAPDQDWHVYAYEKSPPTGFQYPTLIEVSLPEDWTRGDVLASASIISEPSPLEGEPPTRYYDGSVTWSLPIEIPDNVQPGRYRVEGHVALQTCSQTCDAPTAIGWSSMLEVTSAGAAHENLPLASIQFAQQPSPYKAVVERLSGRSSVESPAEAKSIEAGVGFDPEKLQVRRQSRGIVWILCLAFVGGFILNFMPCVLPVIGLKIMSFVDQAGENRARVFSLNVWYALGMLSIFWILATLAAAPALGLRQQELGWGQQFNYDSFNIPLICVVFAMGLSFLGVWEIPIPGFATSTKASELAEKEGVSGAFCKGIITTLLATPCSAPGLATAYGWTVSSKSPPLAYLVFTVMGLGMALPYLVIGAFPRLVRFLPRPGAWMETFKQLMGFVLLGTVIFLLSNVDWPNLVPTVALLFGLWLACWWIGRVPFTAEQDQRLRAWAVAFVIGLIVTTVAFTDRFDAFERTFYGIRGAMAYRFNAAVDRTVRQRGVEPEATPRHSANELPWEPYSDALLQELTSSQQTVLVDFTADW